MEDKWVLAMESVIKQVIDLANALENVLIQADLVNLLTTNSDKWRRKKKKRSWSEAGFVETLSKQIGSSIIGIIIAKMCYIIYHINFFVFSSLSSHAC